ncbi:MAG: hypothetical protein QW040_03635 [Candidatus Aenigmatarchaeota archaeon]
MKIKIGRSVIKTLYHTDIGLKRSEKMKLINLIKQIKNNGYEIKILEEIEKIINGYGYSIRIYQIGDKLTLAFLKESKKEEYISMSPPKRIY